MNLLQRLFGKKSNGTQPIVKRSYFSVEFYPLTGRYYPKYYDCYLQKECNTGIVKQLKGFLFAYADYGKTEEEADKIIEMFKEQRLKENVRTIEK